MSLFGNSPYQLRPGDAVPFIGSEDAVRTNLLTHDFVMVPNPMLASVFPRKGSVSDTAEMCSVCLMFAPSEAVKYPCGKVERLGPSESRWISPRPKGWIVENRATHNLLP